LSESIEIAFRNNKSESVSFFCKNHKEKEEQLLEQKPEKREKGKGR
jgi:hypothetical protein